MLWIRCKQIKMISKQKLWKHDYVRMDTIRVPGFTLLNNNMHIEIDIHARSNPQATLSGNLVMEKIYVKIRHENFYIAQVLAMKWDFSNTCLLILLIIALAHIPLRFKNTFNLPWRNFLGWLNGHWAKITVWFCSNSLRMQVPKICLRLTEHHIRH